jgi:SulP family sulfate permease
MSLINIFREKFDIESFIPKTIVCLREGYTKKLFGQDLAAGITVGFISLPLAMAFAIGSGVPPERGLFTAIIAGFLISLLGGSRFQIGGPTGAYIVILFTIVQKHGYDGLLLAILLASIILIILGLSKCGTYIRFIPYPVTTGFTSGIAASLFISQMQNFWGLNIPTPSVDFVDRVSEYWEFRDTFNPWSLTIAISALFIIYACRGISKKIPGAILAVIFTAAMVYFLNLPVDTIEKKFGSIPNMLPAPSLPHLSLKGIQAAMPDAITIAVLGAIESLLSCVVADGMTGFRHKSNLELVAQGVGNFGSALFGGIAATGAVARTTANIQNGGKTPFAGMIHAVTLLLLMVLAAPLAGKIPLATLAAVLIVVAIGMAEIEHFKDILRGPKSDALILLTTFSLTVFIDLTVAVQAGVLIAAFMFLKHMSEKTSVKVCKMLEREEKVSERAPRLSSPPPAGVEIFEIEGPFFFGVSDLLNEALRMIVKKPKVFVLRMPTVPFIDSSGMQALRQFHKKCTKQGIYFLICEVRRDVMQTLSAAALPEEIGNERFIGSLQGAIESAQNYLNTLPKTSAKVAPSASQKSS